MSQLSQERTNPSLRIEPVRKRLGYLSGAARVTTRGDATASGPRAHVLGCMSGFRSLGWDVRPFIYGDRIPVKMTNEAGRYMRANRLNGMTADVARMALRHLNRRRALREVGDVDWVYERFASFQSLGKPFQDRGAGWILETNGPFYEEAKTDRGTMALSGLARRFELQAYRDCDVLLCVSNALKGIVCDEGIDPDKVIVIPNGVDTKTFDPARHTPKRLFHEGLVVGFVGRLNEWQGIDRLLRAVRKLHEQGMKLNVAIVGDGLMRQQWQELAKELGIADSVVFTGQVLGEEVPAYIAGFDIGFSGQLPMKIGSMYHSPLKIYEYMAMGRPVLASSYDDARSTIRAGETGFLFHDDEDLVRALTTIFVQHHQLDRMGQAARSQIVQHHSWTARVTTLIKEAKSVMEHRHAKGSNDRDTWDPDKSHHSTGVVA